MFFSKKDYLIFGGLVLLAFLIRIPYLSYPPEPVFDEAHYINFAARTLAGETDIDIHPPLARLIFAGMLNLAPYDANNFPFFRLRLLAVFAGSLLAGIVYLIAQKLYQNQVLALLPALMVIFDGALISYSRMILPDILILFFGFLGILLLLLDSRITLIISGIMFGLAASIKWSGLSFLASGLIYLFLKKKYYTIFLLIFICLGTYLATFMILGDKISEIPSLTQAMFKGHVLIGDHPSKSPPWKWLFADDQFILWGNGKDDIIKISPNLFSWTAVIISLAIAIYLAIKRKSFLYIFLLGGYLVCYLPFFLVSRPLFLYHYLPALIFGFLLVPGFIKLISEILFGGDIKKPALYFAGGVALFFLIFIPFIY